MVTIRVCQRCTRILKARSRAHKRHGLCLECNVSYVVAGILVAGRTRMTAGEVMIGKGEGAGAFACGTLRALERQGCDRLLR